MNNTTWPNLGDLVAITADRGTPIDTCGNLRARPNEQLGTAYYHVYYNEKYSPFVIDFIDSENIEPGSTIVIDAELLKDNLLMDAIRRKFEFDRNHVQTERGLHERLCIRIRDEGYTLTQEDYEKIQYFDQIIVDHCDENVIRQHNNITVQNELYKLDYQELAQPVIERRTNFGDVVHRDVYHINRRLTNEEFEQLVTIINNDEIAAIELNIYDQSYYETFLNKLREHHVKENINIRLIGYPLEDSSSVYRRLQSYPYEIDVQYSLCHDMVEEYEQEPYTENKMLYSHLEGGGITSINNYVNVLQLLEEFQRDIESMNLSPLEIAIYAKMKIDEEYIYDPDVDNSDTDEWDNVNLSQMINHKVDDRKRGVCLGFSTLYSALLRKGNVTLFRDSARGHSVNVGRIKDDKYGVDTLATFDVTFDLQSTVGDTSFSHFGLAPRTNFNIPGGIVNIEAILSLPFEELERVNFTSRDIYETFYHPLSISPIGYLSRMLQLVGYMPEDLEDVESMNGYLHRVYDCIYRLCEEGHLEEIDRNAIVAAAREVLRKRPNHRYNETHYLDRINDTIDDRLWTFYHLPQLENNITGAPEFVDTLTPENVAFYRESLGDEIDAHYQIDPNSRNREADENNQSAENTQGENNPEPEERTPDNPEDNRTNEVQPDTTREPIVEEPTVHNNSTPNPSSIVIDDPVTLELGESSEELIPGTNIHRPRRRGDYETDEEYVEFLRRYYDKYFPNNNYIQNVLNFCHQHNTDLYNYYHLIGNLYQTNSEAAIPEFERENPFITEEDIHLLKSSRDEMSTVYFANAMMRTIEINTENRNAELQDMFSNPEDHYNEEISRTR